MKLCGVPGCDRQHHARGLCHLHYSRWRRDAACARCKRLLTEHDEAQVAACAYSLRELSAELGWPEPGPLPAAAP